MTIFNSGYVSQLEVATWDYIQRYPTPKGVDLANDVPTELNQAPWAPLVNI